MKENIVKKLTLWKDFVSSYPLLNHEAIKEALAHCTHLLNAEANTQTEICKRVQFLPTHNTFIKISAILIFLVASLSIYAQDYYITNADLNLRSGAGKNYKSITVLEKGDTVKLLESSGEYWVKVQHQDEIGFSAKQYLQQIEIPEESQTESGNGFLTFLICLLVVIVTAIILKKAGEKYRNKSTATILSFFFGAFGFQKFYLGETNKGTYSILCCWTYIPSLIGLIDFFRIAFMKDVNFQRLYNQNRKLVKKNIKKKKPQKKDYAKPYSSIDSQAYILDLYIKGLYLDEILNSARDIKLKMPDGTEIVNFHQITTLIRNKISNATFEVKQKKVNNANTSPIAKNTEKEESLNIEVKKLEKIDTEIQKISKKAYPNDLEMQEYIYNEQVESKKFMETVTDEELIEFAKAKYPDDFSMQYYVYKEQAESKVYMSRVKDNEVLSFTLEQYPDDFSMQEYVYKEQVKSKAFMKKASILEIKQFAASEYPKDYSMQEYIYNEQLALPENERTIPIMDNSIIDVNSENLDLNVEKNIGTAESNIEPPYWSHSYVYSYDDIKHATNAQKKYYFHFKNKVLNGEFVDIQSNTNYAFILYFDFLNEYQNHRDIELLDKQFKLLGEICPKTRSYSFRSLQDELRKRSDSYSVDKLKDLEEPNYQFENGYKDYNPDLYKLGNKYKDKLGLTKQEIRWLNKFYNPTNVFLSIEGCCVATIMKYVTVLKELEKQLKKNETTLVKEVSYFKEKLKAIYLRRHSDWGYYDASYLGNQAESEVYLTMFKRVENSIRDSYGHKRKVSGDFSYADKSLSDEFENRLGNAIGKLILELKNNVGEPDLETKIALNIQNVNRWKTEFEVLKNNFKKEEKEKFAEAIITIEETNQKNPNIENIFFDASKFIAKYDKVQALKYYAKYIYYDLKSKKFDNKELTKTVQKSLFKTDEQINDFKAIIADLIQTGEIQNALDKISNIYVPKRKKIKLDRTEIKEVEQKHEGTVELLNEYLVVEKEKTESETEINSEEDIEIAIIPSDENNSIFISEISMGKVQEELVKMIVNNSYEIQQDVVDKYATKNGMFKNQLIDSINEVCEEHLDGEALIEEDDENYVIEESYYIEIVN